jgi:hypothetical protein
MFSRDAPYRHTERCAPRYADMDTAIRPYLSGLVPGVPDVVVVFEPALGFTSFKQDVRCAESAILWHCSCTRLVDDEPSPPCVPGWPMPGAGLFGLDRPDELGGVLLVVGFVGVDGLVVVDGFEGFVLVCARATVLIDKRAAQTMALRC